MLPEIKIYGPIGGNSEDAVTVRQVSDALEAIGEVPEIKVRISSDGGSVRQGLTIAKMLKDHPALIHTIVEGGAYSIAGYIACCGDKRTICSDAIFHFHGPRLNPGEIDLQEGQSAVKQLEVATNSMQSRYSELTGYSTDQIADMFRRDNWFTATEAVQIGLMTEVGSESEVFASVNTDKFLEVPERFAVALARQSGNKNNGVKQMTKSPATVKQMRSQFSLADDSFILNQIEAEATIEDARANYVNSLETRLVAMEEGKEPEAMEDQPPADLESIVAKFVAKAMDQYTSAMDEEPEAMEEEEVEAKEEEEVTASTKDPFNRPIGVRAANKSNRTSSAVAQLTAQAEVDQLVASKMTTNKVGRRQALRSVFQENPKLQERLVKEANK